jgi:hypothetical protein
MSSQPKTAIELPDVLMLAGSETIDGEAHEAVCSIVYFPSAEERRRCADAASYFCPASVGNGESVRPLR